MAKHLVNRATLLTLLVALGVLLAGCGQGGNSNGGLQTASTPISSASSTPSTQGDIASALATATVLAGNENSNSTTSPQGGLDLTSLDPCSLLTANDVKGAMGDVPFAPKPLDQQADHTACSYVEPTLEVNSPRLSVSIDSPDNWELHTQDVQNVSGIGDQAQTHAFDGWRSLWVLLNNKAVVQIDNYPPDLEKAKQLASVAMSRLP